MAATRTRSAAAPAATRQQRRRKVSRLSPGVILAYILTTLYALTLILPLYWLLISAFKSRLEILSSPFLPSFSQGFDNFTRVWELLDITPAIINSIYITAGAIGVTLLLAVPASYALARSKGRIGGLVEKLYALGFLIPGLAALIPTLLLAIWLGMYAQREFMILYLPAAAQPLAVILLTQFMRTVPQELEEGALMDGAGRLRILVSIYLPLVRPGIAMVAILNFISFWNEYLYTLIIVGVNPARRTLQVALPTLQGNQGITDYALVCAGTVIAVAPVFLVYIVLNRRMENALTQGAVKG
jgi:multiple sugar transport system permease protein